MVWAAPEVHANDDYRFETVHVTTPGDALLAHADRGFSGAVRVLRDGETVFLGAAGLRNYRDTVRGPVEPTDGFPIGSISKQFTAAAILRTLGVTDVLSDP